MAYSNMKMYAAAAVVLLPGVFAGPVEWFSKRQNPLMEPIPGCSRSLQQQYQPAFDFDTDTCYHAPAVGPDGSVNPGRDTCDIADADDEVECRQQSYLDNGNVYVRSRTNNGWTAMLYAYYAEVDAKSHCSGHRHDWEHVVVWLEGETVRYVAASAHGGYSVRSIDDVLQDNGHPEIVYHKDGGNTHAMRFAKEEDGEEIENHTGKWYYGTLVDYYGFPTRELRDAMMDNDWGNGKIDFSDARIAEALEKAKGDYDIPLDTGSDEEGSTDNPCS